MEAKNWMRIAVVGTGIAGMTAAWLLHRDHEITVFEANARIGGHTHTVDVLSGGAHFAVDTGFIVFNEWTYPNFIALLTQLGVPSQASDMSFSVSCARTGLEYNPQMLAGLFAQPRNAVRPSFYRMLGQIVRFMRQAKAFLRDGDPAISLEEFLDARHFGTDFREHFLIPMLSAIWSADPNNVMAYPAQHFLQFFANHGLLNLVQTPTWRVIQGGSSRYAERLTAPYADRIRLSTPVSAVWRGERGVWLKPKDGVPEHYDHVILAVHSDEALAMLPHATASEHAILGAIPYQANDVVLHTDASLLPKARRAWASWNYHVAQGVRPNATVTYHMNRLQGLKAPVEFCVTLNGTERIDPALILRRFTYRHPMFSSAGMAAQRRHAEISGVDGLHFCGAYWGYGFHEDGVNSALAVCKHFGKGIAHAQLPVHGTRAAPALHAG